MKRRRTSRFGDYRIQSRPTRAGGVSGYEAIYWKESDGEVIGAGYGKSRHAAVAAAKRKINKAENPEAQENPVDMTPSFEGVRVGWFLGILGAAVATAAVIYVTAKPLPPGSQ